MTSSLKKWCTGIGLIVVAWPTIALGKSNELILQKTYDAPVDRVFASAVQSAGPTLVNSVKDACLVNFQSRQHSYPNWYMIISWTAICKDAGNGKTILTIAYQINTNMFGGKSAAKKDATKFWSNMDTALRDMAPSGSSTAMPAPPTSSPSVPAPTGKAAVAVTSAPQGAVITIDGNYAGNTPSDLQLMPGSHTVTIELKGYEKWERTIKVEAGETRRFSADLGKPEN